MPETLPLSFGFCDEQLPLAAVFGLFTSQTLRQSLNAAVVRVLFQSFPHGTRSFDRKGLSRTAHSVSASAVSDLKL